MEIGSFFLCFFGLALLVTISIIAISIRIVREDTRLSVYRLGRYLGDRGPGVVILAPFIDRGVLKDLGGVEKVTSRKVAGTVGEASTTVFTDGKVILAGEEWDAVSQSPISAGQRVVRMILEVEQE